MKENDQYASFMIHLWLLDKDKQLAGQAGRQMEIEHIQSGQYFIVESFENLVEQMKDHLIPGTYIRERAAQ